MKNLTHIFHKIEDEKNEFTNFVKYINIPALSNTESGSTEGVIKLDEASIVFKEYGK